MDSIIAFFCIIGLCVYMYAYQMMRRKYKDYSHRCNVLYVPRHDETTRDKLPHMEVLEHEEHDSKFIHAKFSTAPRGISEIDTMLPRNNIRYDSINRSEYGG